jgi:hypothetical protein
MSTKRLLGRMFELHPLQPQLVKGFAARVEAWSVIQASENVTRFDASRLGAMTPFAGREHELALPRDRRRKTTENESLLVLVSCEAGIGKSRITVAFALAYRSGWEYVGANAVTTVGAIATSACPISFQTSLN